MSHIIDRVPGGARNRVPRLWWGVLVLSLAIAAYGAGFVVRGEASFTGVFAAAYRAHSWGILSHATFGTLALLAGPLQFRRDLLARRRRLHRIGGRIYVLGALGTGATGLFMSAYSYAGMATHVPFALLALLTMGTTGMGLARILAGDVAAHRRWMVRSFSLIFAGVALRVELLPLIAAFGGELAPAYRVVAWLCWVPNLLWAEWWVRRSRGALSLPRFAPVASPAASGS